VGRVDHDASFLCDGCRDGTPSPHIVLWTISGPDTDGRYTLREWAKDDPGDDLARIEHSSSWPSRSEAQAQLPPQVELAGTVDGEEFWLDRSDDQAAPQAEADEVGPVGRTGLA